VSKPIIGIKTANREFYPILDSRTKSRKRLVLTTVRDGQKSVRIDLYASESESMDAAEAVGTISIENIEDKSAGEPEITLLMGVDEENNLTATASDSLTGDHNSLSVSLDEIEGVPEFSAPDFPAEEESLPDFELDEDLSDGPDFSMDEGAETEDELAEEFSAELDDLASEPDFGNDDFSSDVETGVMEDTEERWEPDIEGAEQKPPAYPVETPKKRVNPLLFAAYIVLTLAGLALLIFLIYRALQGPDIPPLEARAHELALLSGIFLRRRRAGRGSGTFLPRRRAGTGVGSTR
jgi:hypothetical protein